MYDPIHPLAGSSGSANVAQHGRQQKKAGTGCVEGYVRVGRKAWQHGEKVWCSVGRHVWYSTHGMAVYAVYGKWHGNVSYVCRWYGGECQVQEGMCVWWLVWWYG